MTYELMIKRKIHIIPFGYAKINKKQINFAQDLVKYFIIKKEKEIIKTTYILVYFDKDNNKIKFKASEDKYQGYSHNRGSLIISTLVKNYKLEIGLYKVNIINNNELEIDLNKKINIEDVR